MPKCRDARGPRRSSRWGLPSAERPGHDALQGPAWRTCDPEEPAVAHDLARADARALSDFIRAIYRAAHEVPASAFVEHAFGLLHGLIEFDSAMWGEGSLDANEPLVMNTVTVHAQPPEMMQNYARFQARDFFAAACMARPGETVSLYDVIPRRDFVRRAVYRHHARLFGIEQILATTLPDEQTGLLGFLVLWRRDPAHDWSPRDRAIKQQIGPHLIEARRLNLSLELRARVPGRHSGGVGLAACDRHGLLHRADATFAALLAEEWPGWRGPMLPAAVARDIGRRREGRRDGERIVIEWGALAELQFVRARHLGAADRLTPREREIAELLAAGRTHKEIAKALAVESTTVRSHMHALHRKLGARNRAQLVRAWLLARDE